MSSSLPNPGSLSLGVVIPAYKEANNIPSLVEEVRRQIPGVKIVVVDDSPDNETVKAMAELNLNDVEIVHRTSKGGRGSAVLEGIRRLLPLGCDRIIEMDADFSHPPSQMPALIAEAEKRNLDLLVASRYLPESRITNWPLARRVFSFCSNRLARFLLKVPICDYTNGYRVYSRRAAEKIVETCGVLGTGFIALSEILVNLYYRDFTVGETPTVFTNRVRGESSVSSSEIRNALAGLGRIYLLRKKLLSAK